MRGSDGIRSKVVSVITNYRLMLETTNQMEIVTRRFNGGPAGFAVDRYAYYVCFKCSKAYYGGEAQCDADVGRANAEDYNPEELVCGGCSDVSRAQV